ncbi:hypothetical protein [Fibrobacter sp.]|uniref:hypothetical protein n=1 Tax=Fibrobacter sp. TaxID=35828 RepID=UPI003863A2E6
MNLFESKIAEITTSDNAIYMEAVNKIFNILFEDQIAQANQTAQASQTSDDSRAKLGSYVAELAKAAEAVLRSSDYFAQNINPAKVTALKTIISSTPEQKSDYDFYNEIKNIVLGNEWRGEDGMVDDAVISDLNQTKQNMAKIGISPDAFNTFVDYKEVLNDFVDNKFTQFTKTTAPNMFKRPPRSSAKTTTQAASTATTVAPATEQPTATATATEQPTTTPTAATPKTATKKPKVKPEPEPEPEEQPSRDFIDAQINTEDKTQSINFENVSDPTGLANYLRSTWELLLQVKGRYNLQSNGIYITEEPEKQSVSMDVSIGGGDMGIINRHMVAMYCLYMDAKKRGLVTKENTFLSEPVANFLALDNQNGKGVLSRLSGFYEAGTYNILTKPEINDLINVLRKDGMADDYNAKIAAAIVAAIEPFSGADLERYEAAKNNKRDPAHTKLNRLISTFNHSIAQVVDNMNPPEAEAADAADDNSAHDEIVAALNKCNIYEYIMDFMADNSRGKVQQTTNDSSYNELAENVITYCKNDLRYQNDELGSRYGSHAEFDDTSTADLRSAVDELSATEQYAPVQTAVDKKFRKAR